MKKLIKCMLVLSVVVLGMGAPISANAKGKSVTAQYRGTVMEMLNCLDGYLGYDLSTSGNGGRFVFDDYAKTNMICYKCGMWGLPTVDEAKKVCEKEMKLFFGKNAKFRLRKYTGNIGAEMQYLYQNDGGHVRYMGGEYGGVFPQGKVSRITKVSAKKYVAIYKEYMKYYFYEGMKYCGRYRVTLKKAKNRYGFIITNIEWIGL